MSNNKIQKNEGAGRSVEENNFDLSFCASVKEDISQIQVRSNCCKTAELYGMLWCCSVRGKDGIKLTFEREVCALLCERLLVEILGCDCDIEYYLGGFRLSVSDIFGIGAINDMFGDLKRVKNKLFRCEGCLRHFLRGIFIAGGSVNSLDAEYHLEISAKRDLLPLVPLFNETGIFPHTSKRGEHTVIYIKKGEEIEDLLHLIGARNAAFSLTNERILRQIKNNANRQKNFDTANIKRSVSANKARIEAVEYLIEVNALSALSAQLRETAGLLLDNPSLSLSELASLHEPPITKSGLTHRLAAIVSAAKDQKERNNH